MHSLRSRLLLTYFILIAALLVIAVAAILLDLRENPQAYRQTYLRLEELARVITRQERAELLAALNGGDLSSVAAGISERYETRLVILDESGRTVADGAPSTPMDFGTMRRTGANRGTVRDSGGQTWLTVSRPAGGGAVTLVLAEAAPRLPAWSLFREEILPPLTRAGWIALGLSILFAVLMARWIAAPLQRLAMAAQSVARGRYDHAVPLEGPSEVRDVAESFNAMARQVDAVNRAQRDFLANVSHDLRTPLTSIGGFAQAILDGTADTPEARQRAAAVIHDESERMRRLVDSLLDLARLDSGAAALKREPVDLAGLLSACLESMRPRAGERRVRLESEIPQVPGVQGDGDRLRQVTLNLLENAIKHTPEGGRVAIRASARDGAVEWSVEDSGPGIPPEELPRIFERFYQVDKSRAGREGVGLGLAISREIVAAHGGSLRAENVPGTGSRFTVRLPMIHT